MGKLMKTISSYVIKTFATAFWFDTINPFFACRSKSNRTILNKKSSV